MLPLSSESFPQTPQSAQARARFSSLVDQPPSLALFLVPELVELERYQATVKASKASLGKPLPSAKSGNIASPISPGYVFPELASRVTQRQTDGCQDRGGCQMKSRCKDGGRITREKAYPNNHRTRLSGKQELYQCLDIIPTLPSIWDINTPTGCSSACSAC